MEMRFTTLLLIGLCFYSVFIGGIFLGIKVVNNEKEIYQKVYDNVLAQFGSQLQGILYRKYWSDDKDTLTLQIQRADFGDPKDIVINGIYITTLHDNRLWFVDAEDLKREITEEHFAEDLSKKEDTL